MKGAEIITSALCGLICLGGMVLMIQVMVFEPELLQIYTVLYAVALITICLIIAKQEKGRTFK